MHAAAMLIRPAGYDDLGPVRTLLAETWHATYDAMLGPQKVGEITDTWHAVERLAAQVDRPDSLFLVAAAGRSVHGTAFAHQVAADVVEIGRLYVLPLHQRLGTGTALLGALLTGFPAARRFHLDVEPRNAGAIRFYRRHGFEVATSGTDCGGSGLAHFRMELMR